MFRAGHAGLRTVIVAAGAGAFRWLVRLSADSRSAVTYEHVRSPWVRNEAVWLRRVAGRLNVPHPINHPPVETKRAGKRPADPRAGPVTRTLQAEPTLPVGRPARHRPPHPTSPDSRCASGARTPLQPNLWTRHAPERRVASTSFRTTRALRRLRDPDRQHVVDVTSTGNRPGCCPKGHRFRAKSRDRRRGLGR